jgi:hypothetical protein
MRTYILIVVFITILFAGCRKDEKDPQIKNTMTSLSSSVFIATAQVLEKGVYEITDHGFSVSFSNESPSYSLGQIISLGRVIEHDTFSTVIDINKFQFTYYGSIKCWVRAYITNKKGTVYSDFVWKSIQQVQVNSLYPSTARAGDTISITGLNFDTDITASIVTFNNTSASVVGATSNRLYVVVPENIVTDYWNSYIDVQVKSSGQQFFLYDAFTLMPSVTSFSPSSGSWNSLITIYGSGLQNSNVIIDDQNVGYNNRTSNSISFNIPQSILSKKFKIYISSGNSRIEVPGEYFTMDEMVIDPLTELNYFPGSTISIRGTGFNPYSYYNKLILGNSTIDANYGNIDNQNFSLPENINAGSYIPVVSNGIDSTRLNQTINIIKPVITGISADSAFPGSTVILSGTNLLMGRSYYPYLYLGNYGFSPNSGDNSRFYMKVPFINPGPYTLRVVYNGFDIFYNGNFTVRESSVTSVNPTTGLPETTVILNGMGFGDVSNTNVYFGNLQCQILSMSSTQINVKVPSQITTGSWLVQVYINGYKLTSTATFTVL